MLGLLRIVTALLFVEHGTQKLFHFPAMGGQGGGGGAGGGMPPFMGTLFLVAGVLETFGGLGILLGLLTRPIAFVLAGEHQIDEQHRHCEHHVHLTANDLFLIRHASPFVAHTRR